MEINLEKLEEIYGKSLVKEMHDDIENLIENMKYLDKLEFDDIYDIIEVNPYLFLIDNNELIEKSNIKMLIDKTNEAVLNWSQNIEVNLYKKIK